MPQMAGPAPSASASQAELNAILGDALPRQGAWSDEEYLWLTDRSRRLIEFTDGYVQGLPWPTSSHQAILAFLYRLFHAWVRPRGGVVLFSALRLRVREGKFREPDLLLLRDRADPRCQDRYWLGADLVVEVVSPDRPERDLLAKAASGSCDFTSSGRRRPTSINVYSNAFHPPVDERGVQAGTPLYTSTGTISAGCSSRFPL